MCLFFRWYSRVAALEKKVKVLTAALRHKNNSSASESGLSESPNEIVNNTDLIEINGPASSSTPENSQLNPDNSYQTETANYSNTPTMAPLVSMGYGALTPGAGSSIDNNLLPAVSTSIPGRFNFINMANRVTKQAQQSANLKSILFNSPNTPNHISPTTNQNFLSAPYFNSNDVKSPTSLPHYNVLSNFMNNGVNSALTPPETNLGRNTVLPPIFSQIYNNHKSFTTYESSNKHPHIPFSNLVSYGDMYLQSQSPDMASKPIPSPSSVKSNTVSIPAHNTHSIPGVSVNNSEAQQAAPLAESLSEPLTEPRDSEFNVGEIRAKLFEQWQLIANHDRFRVENVNSAPRSRSPSIENDIVSQGVISIAEAERRLHMYKSILYKTYPIITIPEEMDITTMRKELPFLFLTIMNVSSSLLQVDDADMLARGSELYKKEQSNSTPVAPGSHASNMPDADKSNGQPSTHEEKHAQAFKTAVTINNQCIDSIMYDVMILGNKTLELLRSLILINMWYNTPEMYHHQKAHLITHMCITVAFDLGLGGYCTGAASSGPSLQQSWVSGKASFMNTEPSKTNEDPLNVSGSPDSANKGKAGDSANNETNINNGSSSKSIKYDRILRPYMLLNPHSYTCRKLWLCVYMCSINVSLVIKRPVYMMWSRYTEECCEMLEHPDRPSDERRIAVIARLHHLLEQLSTALQTNDPRNPPNVNDPRTQSLLKYFEWQLNKISKKSVEDGFRSFNVTFYAIQLFLFESAMYIPYSATLGRSPYTEYSLALGVLKTTMAVTEALGACHSASTNMIKLFISQSPQELSCIPMFTYSRMVLAVSVLLKLRTLYLTVPDMRSVCVVTEEQVKQIGVLLEKLDIVNDKYAFANCTLNYSLVVRILVYHYERQLHFYNEYQKGLLKQQQSKKNGEQVENETHETNEYMDETTGLNINGAESKGNRLPQHQESFQRYSMGSNSNTSSKESANSSSSRYTKTDSNSLPATADRIDNQPVLLNSISNDSANFDTSNSSFHKRSEAERDVILFMQKQQNGNQLASAGTASTTPGLSGPVNNLKRDNAGEIKSLFSSPSNNQISNNQMPNASISSSAMSTTNMDAFSAAMGNRNIQSLGNLGPLGTPQEQFFDNTRLATGPDANGRGVFGNASMNQNTVGSNMGDTKVNTTNDNFGTAPDISPSLSPTMNVVNGVNGDNGMVGAAFAMNTTNNMIKNNLGLPAWLFEESWKDLASSAEALSGFDLFG